MRQWLLLREATRAVNAAADYKPVLRSSNLFCPGAVNCCAVVTHKSGGWVYVLLCNCRSFFAPYVCAVKLRSPTGNVRRNVLVRSVAVWFYVRPSPPATSRAVHAEPGGSGTNSGCRRSGDGGHQTGGETAAGRMHVRAEGEARSRGGSAAGVFVSHRTAGCAYRRWREITHSPGPIFKSRLLRTKYIPFHYCAKQYVFSKAVGEISFSRTPCSGPTLVLMCSNRAPKTQWSWGGCYLVLPAACFFTWRSFLFPRRDENSTRNERSEDRNVR